jgi:hypothetical protein
MNTNARAKRQIVRTTIAANDHRANFFARGWASVSEATFRALEAGDITSVVVSLKSSGDEVRAVAAIGEVVDLTTGESTYIVRFATAERTVTTIRQGQIAALVAGARLAGKTITPREATVILVQERLDSGATLSPDSPYRTWSEFA